MFNPNSFLGASVRSVSSSVGWNLGQSSTLTVGLVEDPRAGDRFTPVPVGTPAYFELGGFRFHGLLQRWEGRRGPDGAPTYEVTLVDPREILEGTQVVLAAYSGPVTAPNLLNVFGHWESQAFGLSYSNEAGIPWTRVRDGVLALTNRASATPYGGPLRYRGVSYSLDLSQLPQPPAGYRVGGSVSVGLLELIAQICDDGACDFFVELSGFTIRVRTVSRRTQPPLGTITALAGSQGVVRSSAGLEARNEVTSSFLVGGDVHTLHVTESLTSFWGYDINGAPVLGSPARHHLLDPRFHGRLARTVTAAATTLSFDGWQRPERSRWPKLPVYVLIDDEIVQLVSLDGGVYKVKRGQLGTAATAHVKNARCTLAFWSLVCDHMTLNASPIADLLGVVGYPTNTLELRCARANFESWAAYVNSQKPDVAARLGLNAPLVNMGGKGRRLPQNLVNNARRQAVAMAEAAVAGDRFNRQLAVYEFVRAYADEYMGRRYAVQLPFVLSKQDPETLKVAYSYDIADGGYLPEGSRPLGLSALNEDLFKLNDGRFRAFCVFRNLNDLDFTQAAQSNVVVDSGALYMDVQADGQIVFAPTPIAVITLASALTEEPVDTVGDINVVAALLQMKSDEAKDVLANSALGTLGLKVMPAARAPGAVAIPLRSNTQTYGPWQSSGPPGKVRFEQDPSLTPWNYGSYDSMNRSGLARVSESLTNMQVSESGLLEIPGVPAVGLGDVLQAGGPNVTNIQVSYAAGGVTTTYSFATFTPRFGVFSRGQNDRYKRLALGSVEARRLLRQNARDRVQRGTALAGAARAAQAFQQNAPKAVRRQSPHDCLVGRALADTEPDDAAAPGLDTPPSGYVRLGVSSATLEEAVAFCGADQDSVYRDSAVMSLSGLVRPFSTSPEHSGAVPKYAPAPPPDAPLSRTRLDPFGGVSDVEIYSFGQSYDVLHAGLREHDGSDARLFGLRGPLLVVGWGYDLHGDPVPGSGGTFLPEHRRRSDAWKAGPVDLLWDERRGVWTCHDVLCGTAAAHIAAGSDGVLHVASGLELAVVNRGAALASGQAAVALFDAATASWLVQGQPAATGTPNTLLHYDSSGNLSSAPADVVVVGSTGSPGVLEVVGPSGGYRILPGAYPQDLILPGTPPGSGDSLQVVAVSGATATLAWLPADPAGPVNVLNSSGDGYVLTATGATTLYTLNLPAVTPATGQFLQITAVNGDNLQADWFSGPTLSMEYVQSVVCTASGLTATYGRLWFTNGVLTAHSGVTL